ncbi:MAG: putative zinc-binding protein [Candidatus Hinthialibacter antarcticus]|nr:putative zinc-binding protein [Candidatus Hinthialibacter antarcticus]
MNITVQHTDKPMVFACSGAADVGAISDQAARRLAKEKDAPMCCVAAIAAGIPEIEEKAKQSSQIIVIDGCTKDCAKHILAQAGFNSFTHIQLEDMGMKKGESPATEERINEVVDLARRSLA